MHRNQPRLLSVLAISLWLAGAPLSAMAQEAISDGGGGDTAAVAINTKDGSSKFKVSFRIVRTSSDVIDESNIAVAFASCEACRTVAISFQIVLVNGTPSIVIPENFAIALNFECTSCETLASAFQFVLGVDGQVHFSPEGSRALAEIRKAIRDVARSEELSLDEMQAELDLLAADLRTVLAEEVVASGPDDVEVEQVEPASTEPVPAPSPSSEDPSPAPTSAANSPSPTPAATATGESPSPTASPTPTASASPSPSPSPSPSVSP